jgi:cell division protein ZapA (FtsZ GTPase activity inhibitor)
MLKMQSLLGVDKLKNTDELSCGYWMAFDQIKRGTARDIHLNLLMAALMISKEISEASGKIEHLETILKGIDGAAGVKARYQKLNKYGFSGEEMQNVSAALLLHDKQLGAIGKLKLHEAVLRARKHLGE